jgi:hypothetical protein
MGLVNNENYEDYEKTGNDHSAWDRTFKILMASSCILEKEYNKALKQMHKQTSGIVLLGFELLPVRLMLKGMATECWFKTIYLKQGKKLVENNRISQPKKFQNHNLIRMAEQIDLTLDKNERDALDILSQAIKYFGRFPVPTKRNDWRQKIKRSDGVKIERIQPVWTWSGCYDNAINKMVGYTDEKTRTKHVRSPAIKKFYRSNPRVKIYV